MRNITIQLSLLLFTSYVTSGQEFTNWSPAAWPAYEHVRDVATGTSGRVYFSSEVRALNCYNAIEERDREITFDAAPTNLYFPLSFRFPDRNLSNQKARVSAILTNFINTASTNPLETWTAATLCSNLDIPQDFLMNTPERWLDWNSFYRIITNLTILKRPYYFEQGEGKYTNLVDDARPVCPPNTGSSGFGSWNWFWWEDTILASDTFVKITSYTRPPTVFPLNLLEVIGHESFDYTGSRCGVFNEAGYAIFAEEEYTTKEIKNVGVPFFRISGLTATKDVDFYAEGTRTGLLVCGKMTSIDLTLSNYLHVAEGDQEIWEHVAWEDNFYPFNINTDATIYSASTYLIPAPDYIPPYCTNDIVLIVDWECSFPVERIPTNACWPLNPGDYAYGSFENVSVSDTPWVLSQRCARVTFDWKYK